jgi:hypothetical protein
MIKDKIKQLKDKFDELTPTAQGLVILGIVLVIGIILRWEYIITEIGRGFGFFSGE